MISLQTNLISLICNHIIKSVGNWSLSEFVKISAICYLFVGVSVFQAVVCLKHLNLLT